MTIPNSINKKRGFTYVELLITVSISGMIMLALMGVVNTATETEELVGSRNDMAQQARFALNRMVNMTARSPGLLLPLLDNPATNWPENLREQTIPASPPIGDSTFASAVLAIKLPHDIDLDQDGVPDADDDRDGKVDEDMGQDNTKDSAAGIYLIDDDGDGNIDESIQSNDDEDNDDSQEDPIDGIDNDGDGSIDEDNPNDMNGDGCSGLCGVDDDGDGNIDESDINNDDEQGGNNEDWINPVVFYLDNGTLKERIPVPWDENVDSSVDGRDFITSELAKNVTRFRVERINHHNNRDLVDLTLELTDPITGETISLQTRVRVGGNL